MKFRLAIFSILFSIWHPVSAENYQYDQLNRMVEVEFSNGDIVDFEYDPAGNITKREIIYSPRITVSNPNTATSWQRGSTQTISWTSKGEVGSNVKIELRRGSSLESVIISTTANDGAYDWSIPSGQALGSDYKVKISSTTDLGIFDLSDVAFSIVAEPASLTSLALSGLNSVNENSSNNYIATASFSDGSTAVVTASASWSENSSYASVSSSGVLTTTEVPSNQMATLSASYTYSGVTKSASKVISINDVVVPKTLQSIQITGANSVDENTGSNYLATAFFSDGSTSVVTASSTWSEDSSFATISNVGVLSTSEVTTNQSVNVSASYTFSGVTKSASKAVTINDVVVPVTLQSIQITGANSVDENTTANFLATAFFSDGSTSSVTASAAWSENSALASINSNGQLTAGDVPANQVVTVSASYFYAGVTKSATKNVTIIDVPVIADLTSIRILGANSVVGGQTRQYTIEATFSNGTKDTLTSAATWAENSSFATITQSGLLNTQSVDVDRPVTISASYETDGITKTNTLLVQVTPKKNVSIAPIISLLLSEDSTVSDTEPPVATLRPLNDTGITLGGNYPSGASATCTSNMVIGGGPNAGNDVPQDCNSGRDASQNDNSDGVAGFSFTNISANGSVCVQDNVTGLMWERKTDDGTAHDKDNTYQWGGVTAQGRDHPSRQGTYYDGWNVLVNHANNNNLCGYNDWRVPTIDELGSLVNFAVYSPSPTIDAGYFPNTQALRYWSSTPIAYHDGNAWNVFFGYGGAGHGNRSSGYHVRLVR